MIVEFQNITKSYGKKYALNSLNAVMEKGVYGLLGPNGAGKTTLINIFIGILKKDSGNILINGEDVSTLGTEFLSHIGYLPQYPQFYRNFTVDDFMEYICVLKNVPKDMGRKRTEELLEMVNLIENRKKKVGALSGGMRQRLGIAQAMLNNPDILILDEPTAGLDPQERIRFRNLISRFSENRIVLLATHIVSDLEFIANEVLLLKKGTLVRQDKPRELTQEIKDKVWTLTISSYQLSSAYDEMRISNMIHENDGVHLRMISDKQPDSQAVNIMPNLEDVFLYHCSEEGDR